MRLSVPRILAIVFCFVALLPSLIADELVSDRDPTKIQKEITNSIGMKLRRIPAGTFLMGSPESEKGRGKDEGPQHPVKISKPFYMGVYEVTQAEHEKVMGRNPSYFRRDGRGGQKVQGMDTSSFPVETVSWDDAVAFCKKLSEMPAEKKAGRVYRLPTEAEWEYACRGGTKKYQIFALGNSLSSLQENFDGNYPYGGAKKGPYLNRPNKVGSYKPNGYGLHDMHANVCEWCSDWYGADVYTKAKRVDPKGPKTGSRRCLRSCSYIGLSRYCRSARRGREKQGNRARYDGFRVVLITGR